MSSILKALKRLEEEKASRDGGQVDISRDILLGDSGATSRGGRAGLWIALALLTVAIVGGAFVWVNLDRGKYDHKIKNARATQNEQKEMAVGAPKPGLEVKATPVDRKIVHISEPDSQPDIVEKLPLPKAPEPKTIANPKPINIPEPATPVIATRLELPLVVSGIVYQENSADRLAVVNDLPVMPGTVIDGYTVSEIERDRVWFTKGDVRVAVGLEE